MNQQEVLDRTSAIIDTLDGLQWNEQLACLTGAMMCYIIANLSNEVAEQVVASISAMLPRQYMEARALHTA